MKTNSALSLEAEFVVVGSGFAGSLTALALRRLGHTVVLVERGRHPRFAIGESSTPLANLLLERLCDRYALDRVRPLCKMGTWRRTYPGIARGLKRGFSFFHHTPGQPFADDEEHERQLLVAASPHDEVADTHWYRPDVDAFLASEAARAGAVSIDETAIGELHQIEDGVSLAGDRLGSAVEIRAGFLIDASGPRGFLHRTLGLAERPLQWLPGTQTLYAHFADVDLWENVCRDTGGEAPPYPVDAAALHHVFPGGWIWVLRFDTGITSAGAALTDQVADSIRLSEGASAWSRLLAQLPSVAAQFARARAVTPFTYAPRLAFRSARIVGPRWAMLPSAAGVIDPLLSTGFPLTLLGVHRLVECLARHAHGPGRESALEAYARQTDRELDATERLVAALYAAMPDVTLFKRLTLLYFAAASYSETVRRLGHDERAPGFLLCDDPVFASEMRGCAEAALAGPQGPARRQLLERIDRAIAPFDVAGLRDRARRDWYPVRAEDLLDAAARLGATDREVRTLLERSGFYAAGAEVNAGPEGPALHSQRRAAVENV
jgi:tetracycline 7-halogenase / FADH2 O2-dependent halogenase